MIYLTQIIFVKEGSEKTFHEFENFAIPLMKEHQGKLIYRIRPKNESFIDLTEKQPYEIHFISFESDQHFGNFMNDERRLKFIELKNKSIDFSILTKGVKL